MSEKTNVTPNSKSNWNEQKAKLRTKFSNLTDADLHYEDGKKDEMLTRVQTKLGKTREELDTVLNSH